MRPNIGYLLMTLGYKGANSCDESFEDSIKGKITKRVILLKLSILGLLGLFGAAARFWRDL